MIFAYDHISIYLFQILHENFLFKCLNLVTILQDLVDDCNLLNEIFSNS